MMYELNLPAPSLKLRQMVIDETVKLDFQMKSVTAKNYHENLNPNIKSAEHHFGDVDQDFNDFVNEELGHCFKLPIHTRVGLFHNVGPGPSVCQPHVDQNRLISINYYLETGGDNVVTVIYNAHETDELREHGKIKLAHKLNKMKEYVLRRNTWAILNACQYHAVYNIESTRILLSLQMNCSFDDFLKLHDHLIVGEASTNLITR